MKIGLLLCDHVAEQFLDISGDYADDFARLFAPWSGMIEWRSYDLRNGEFPWSLRECDAWMVTGSRSSAYDDEDWIDWLKGFVRLSASENKPFVGICFGHQVIAEALGGEVQRADSGWGVGVHPIAILPTASAGHPGNSFDDLVWMSPFQPSVSLHYLHQDQVLTLPAGSVLLGASEHCPHAIYRVGERMLAIQAHPELPKAYLEAVIQDRRELIGEEKVAAALARLDSPTSESLVAKWIMNFLSLDSVSR